MGRRKREKERAREREAAEKPVKPRQEGPACKKVKGGVEAMCKGGNAV